MAMSRPGLRVPFGLGDLIDAPLMTAAGERRREPDGQNLVRQPEGDDAAAHREDVRVVVLA